MLANCFIPICVWNEVWYLELYVVVHYDLNCSDTEPFVIFSGGMARGSYGDKFTVSVIQDEKHVTFDFTSRVLDFLVLCTADEETSEEGT